MPTQRGQKQGEELTPNTMGQVTVCLEILIKNYADFQKVLSSKVLDDLSRDDSLSSPHNLAFPPGNKYPFPPPSLGPASLGSLSCPIIISQQDFGDGIHTWGRTYTPELMSCGIDQRTFLSFLDSFNESMKVGSSICSVILHLLTYSRSLLRCSTLRM
jgi:hypothetical protein